MSVSTPIFTTSSETCALAAPLVQTKSAAKPASQMRCIVILPKCFPAVIASEAKQSSAEAPPGLLRRFAPRNDASLLLRHEQVLPLVDTGDLAGADDGGAVELIEDGRSVQGQADIEFFALIHRTGYRRAVETHLPCFDQGIGKRAAFRRELRHGNRRHDADAADAIGHDFDRLLGRHVAE